MVGSSGVCGLVVFWLLGAGLAVGCFDLVCLAVYVSCGVGII